MIIKILGSGCKNCAALGENATAAGKEAEIVRVTDLAEIAACGVMSTPGLVVDEKVVSTGKALAALAARTRKGIERVTPILRIQLDGAEVRLEAVRQDAPPKLTLIRYEIVLDSAETDQRLDLLHRNVLKYGTISNTPAAAVPLDGRPHRAAGRG